MSHEQARIADAINALAHRFAQVSEEVPHARASEFIGALVRQGWRPVAPATVHPIRPTVTSPATEEYRAAMAELRARRKCSHGVDPERCADHNAEALERAKAAEPEDHNESEEA